MVFVGTTPCFGVDLDAETRCKHYHSDLDRIAIKFPCCGQYYACIECHQETADHPAHVWPKEEFEAKAILCGACGTELTITEYLQCDSNCPKCQAQFNPGCKNHWHLYFER